MNGVKRKRGFTVCVCVGPERGGGGGGGGGRERDREREKEKETERGRVCLSGLVCIQGDWSEVVWGGLEWFGGGLGLTWQVYKIQMLLNSFFKSSYYHKNIFWVLRKWFGVV